MRALVVDDVDGVRRLAAQWLEEEGHEVEQAPSGEEALVLFWEGGDFDLLLCDLVLPGGVGGVEVISEATALFPGLRAVAMTGAASSALQAAREAGASAALPKPFTRAALLQALLGPLAGPVRDVSSV